jgi:hypothetical protein
VRLATVEALGCYVILGCCVLAACGPETTPTPASADGKQDGTDEERQPLVLPQDLSRTVDESSGFAPGVLSVGFVNSTCTATLISKKGHLLAARHCIEDAIAFANMREGYEFLVMDQPTPSIYQYTYTADLTGLLQIPFGLDDAVVYGSVVATGPGTLSPRFDNGLGASDKAMHRELTDDGYSAGGDYVILHVPVLADRHCRRLGFDRPAVGATSQIVSFSCFRDPDIPWPHDRAAANSVVAGDEGKEATGHYLPRGGFRISVTARACNSGSPVLNEEGRVHGVLHTVVPVGNGSEEAVAMSVHRIFELLEPQTATFLRGLNAECP